MQELGRSPFHPDKIGLYSQRLERLARKELVAPISAEVDLTDGGCNQGCAHCSFGSGFMRDGITQIHRGTLISALTDMRNAGTQGVEFVGGGEPLVHREAAGIMTDTMDLGLDSGIVTNGVLLQKILRPPGLINRLRFVRVSLDSANPETYRALHGAQAWHFDRVTKNVEEVSQAMSQEQHDDMALGLGYLVVPPFNHSEAEIRDAIDLANKLGADYMVFRPAQLKTPVDPELWKEAQAAITRAQNEAGEDSTKLLSVAPIRWQVVEEETHPTGLCESRPLVAVIQANGDIAHCILYRNDRGMALGNINDQSFNDIWFSPENQRRLEEFQIDNCPSPCKHFRYNEVVRAVQQSGELPFVHASAIGHPNHV